MDTWTPNDVRALGVRTDITTASAVLGISRNCGYQLAARHAFPVPVLHLGSRYVVPVAGLLRALGLSADHTEAVA